MDKVILDFLMANVEEIFNQIDNYGYVLGGSNGPYDDNETPVRLSAHWIYIFGFLLKKTEDEKYLKYTKKLANYLYEYKFQNNVYCYECRNKKGKDHINGTIGQAWIIEGLISASKILGDDKYYELAKKLFLAFPYNKKVGCWNRYEIDGKLLGYDETFNHQLWYAAAGAEILKYKEDVQIKEMINDFLNHCYKSNDLFRIRKDGVICHYAHIKNGIKDSIRYYKREIKNAMNGLMNKATMRYKEEGYHYFALYGFAILKDTFQNHQLFESKKIKKAVEYAKNNDNYLRQLKNESWKDVTGLANKVSSNCNIYCFPYNSPVYEIPYIIKKLDKNDFDENVFFELWNSQKDIILTEEKRFTDNVVDKKTLLARIYELLKVCEE